MRLYLRAARLAALILILATAAWGQATFTQSTGPDLPGKDGGTPRLVAGPYVQNVSTSAATTVWQTDCPTSAELSLSDGGAAETFRTDTPRRLAEVRVGKLVPDSLYTYSVRIGNQPVAGGSFRTFPLAPRPVRFIVYGDTRTNPDRHRQVIEAMAREPGVEFVLHTGDVVSDGRKLDVWIPEFLGPAEKMMRSVPFFPVLGNHEHNSASYFTYFALPGNERYYSFDLGEIHIIALDSNTGFDIGSEQCKWLIRDLAAHREARWKFVFMHHPTYTSGSHGAVSESGVPKETPIRLAQELLPKLAKQFGITAVFAGHDHAYERSVRDGVTYVVTGGGGAPSYGDPNARHNPYRKVFYSGLHCCLVSVDGNGAGMIVKTPKGKIIDRIDL